MSLVSRAPKAAADEGGPFFPASCPYGSWPDGAPDVQLKDYNDGDIAACDGCSDYSDVVWDGTFERHTGACYWKIPAAFNTMDGKRLHSVSAPSYLYLTATGWRLTIFCYVPTIPVKIWSGYKVRGNTPVGVYKRDSGCDTTATLEIEQTP